MYHIDAARIKSLTSIAQECSEPYWTIPRSYIPLYSSYTVTYLPSLKPLKSDKQDMQDNAG